MKHLYFRVKQLSASGVPVTLGFSSSTSSGQDQTSPEYCGRRVQERLNAGADLLKAYQDQWESMHAENEANAALASECDVQISKLRRKVEADWSHVASLQTLASQVARVAEQVGQAEELLNGLESEFSRVEVALLGLEDTLDARQMQARQEGQAREVDKHENRRKKQFEQLSSERICEC